MSDLISRQAAIEGKICIRRSNGVEIYDDYVVPVKYLEQLPPAQPEIIRCKDCKYAEYIDDVKTFWCTECGQGRTVAPNDFCSYAERRE